VWVYVCVRVDLGVCVGVCGCGCVWLSVGLCVGVRDYVCLC
jgi:hypothetical protein